MGRSYNAVVGADISLRHAGFCLIPSNWDVTHDRLVFKHSSYKKKGVVSDCQRVTLGIEYAGILRSLLSLECSSVVAIEGYAFHANTRCLTGLAEVIGIVRAELYKNDMDIEVLSIPPSQARSFLLNGVRRKRKSDILYGIQCLSEKKQVDNFLKNRGIICNNDDLSDAFAIAYYAYCKINKLPRLLGTAQEDEKIVRRI